MSNWEQELVDFINAKAKEHADMPTNKFGYFNLMAQLARHQAEHARVQMIDQYDYPINPTLAEEKDFCLECGVEIVDGGCWGYCVPCVKKLPNEGVKA